MEGRALAHDTTFAFAYYRLAAVLGWVEGIRSERIDVAIEQAMGLVDRLPPRQAALVRGLHAWENGEREEAALDPGFAPYRIHNDRLAAVAG